MLDASREGRTAFRVGPAGRWHRSARRGSDRPTDDSDRPIDNIQLAPGEYATEDVPVTDTVPLARHLVLSNNVRGLAVYHPDDPPEREVFTWLSRKHQYRKVGFPPSLVDHPGLDLTTYKTFATLEYPRDSLRTLHGSCSDGIPDWVRESVLLASAYVTPLFVHRPALDAFADLAVWPLDTAAPLPEDQVLRHMRIAGYGMLDFYEEATARAWNALQDGALEDERARRERAAATDGRERFWRLLDDDPGGGDEWIGGYFDVLPAVAGAGVDYRELDDTAAIGLGLVGGFAIDPPYSS